MPESRNRKKVSYTPPPVSQEPKPNPRWWAPVMVGLMVLGLVYVVTFYLLGANSLLPIGQWNLALGFGIMLAGFSMTMRWR